MLKFMCRQTGLFGPFARWPWRLEAVILVLSTAVFAIGTAQAFELFDHRDSEYRKRHEYPSRGFYFFWTCFLPLFQIIWSASHLFAYAGKPRLIGKRVRSVHPIYSALLNLTLFHAWVVYIAFLWITPHYHGTLNQYICSDSWHERYRPNLGDKPYLPLMTAFGALVCWLLLAYTTVSFVAYATLKHTRNNKGYDLPSPRMPYENSYSAAKRNAAVALPTELQSVQRQQQPYVTPQTIHTHTPPPTAPLPPDPQTTHLTVIQSEDEPSPLPSQTPSPPPPPRRHHSEEIVTRTRGSEISDVDADTRPMSMFTGSSHPDHISPVSPVVATTPYLSGSSAPSSGFRRASRTADANPSILTSLAEWRKRSDSDVSDIV